MCSRVDTSLSVDAKRRLMRSKGYVDKVQPFQATDKWRQDVMQIASLIPRGTVVDLACGTGELFPLVVDGVSNSYIGVDLNAYHLALTNQRKSFEGTSIRTRENLQGLRNVDAVVCVHAIGHLQPFNETIRQVYHILKPGGRFIVVTHNKNNGYLWAISNMFTGYKIDAAIHTEYTYTSLQRMLRDQGFIYVDCWRRATNFIEAMCPLIASRLYAVGVKP